MTLDHARPPRHEQRTRCKTGLFVTSAPPIGDCIRIPRLPRYYNFLRHEGHKRIGKLNGHDYVASDKSCLDCHPEQLFLSIGKVRSQSSSEVKLWRISNGSKYILLQVTFITLPGDHLHNQPQNGEVDV